MSGVLRGAFQQPVDNKCVAQWLRVSARSQWVLTETLSYALTKQQQQYWPHRPQHRDYPTLAQHPSLPMSRKIDWSGLWILLFLPWNIPTCVRLVCHFSSLMDNSEEGNQSAEEGNFTGQDSTDSELDLGDEPFMAQVSLEEIKNDAGINSM